MDPNKHGCTDSINLVPRGKKKLWQTERDLAETAEKETALGFGSWSNSGCS